MRRQRNLLGPQGMGGMVGLWGASSLIRSVQSGTINVTATTSVAATISAVDVNNSVLYAYFNSQANTAADPRNAFVRGELTNGTTVTGYINNASAGYVSYLRYTVIEYAPGVVKQIQRVTQAFGSGSTTVNVTITGVDTTKTVPMLLGATWDTGGVGTEPYEPSRGWFYPNLTTATNLAITRNGTMSVGSFTLGVQVVEFF